MHRFEYRTPRYPIDLPVTLTCGDVTLNGRCRQISKDGMRVEFADPAPACACGQLSFYWRELRVDLQVRVVHEGCESDGLKFLFDSPRERRAVERIVAGLAEPVTHLGPVLVK
jgi:hypothetical protein